MAAINTFTIVGNVTKDLELRYTPNGTPTVTYSVAVNEVWYDNAGVRHEDCDFIPVTTYGKQAENDHKFLKRGSSVAVVGCIRSWASKEEGKRGFNFEGIRVQYLGKLGTRSADGAAPAAGGNPEHDEWMRDYDRAGQAGTPGSR